MKSSRRLALRRETLTELTAAELSLAGGALPAVPLTFAPSCSTDDVREWAREMTLNQHCSWSCI